MPCRDHSAVPIICEGWRRVTTTKSSSGACKSAEGRGRGTHRAQGHQSFTVCSRACREAPPPLPACTMAATCLSHQGLTGWHRHPSAPHRAPRVGQGGCQHHPSTPSAPMPAHRCRQATALLTKPGSLPPGREREGS